jgi:hypothetical protein
VLIVVIGCAKDMTAEELYQREKSGGMVFTKSEFEGHTYIHRYGSPDCFAHDVDCKCGKE